MNFLYFWRLLQQHPGEFWSAVKFRVGLDRKRYVINWIRRNRPSSILEIGVCHGNFASRMLEACEKGNRDIQYVGVDLFAGLMTERTHLQEISLWPSPKEEVEGLLRARFPKFKIQLLEGFSQQKLQELIGNEFDLIIVDGGHSYDTVKSDWNSARTLLSSRGILIFDDYTDILGVDAGGFGIRNVVREIDQNEWKVRYLKRCDTFRKEWGVLRTSLVQVSRNIL